MTQGVVTRAPCADLVSKEEDGGQALGLHLMKASVSWRVDTPRKGRKHKCPIRRDVPGEGCGLEQMLRTQRKSGHSCLIPLVSVAANAVGFKEMAKVAAQHNGGTHI